MPPLAAQDTNPENLEAKLHSGFIQYTISCQGALIQFTFNHPGFSDAATWNFGDPLSGVNNFASGTTSTHVYFSEGDYQITLTDSSANPVNSITETIMITICNSNPTTNINVCDFTLSNAFSPNGDEQNEHFYTPLYCEFSDFSLQIFNRWGNLMYTSNVAVNDWNGSQNGH